MIPSMRGSALNTQHNNATVWTMLSRTAEAARMSVRSSAHASG